jgi:hypothetical protein
MRSDKQPHERGELQRRVSGIIQTGVFSAMSRPGLVVFVQVRQWADFRTCRLTVSLRKLAAECRVGLSTAKRGVDTLVESGVLTERPTKRHDFRLFEVTVPKRRRKKRGPRDDRGRGEKPWLADDDRR